MKRLAIALTCLLVVATVAAALWWLWFSRDVSHRLWASNVLKERGAAAVQIQMIIEHLNAGEIDLARALLNQRLDGDILILDAMLKDTPTDETHVWVTKTLARIGRHRAEHPTPRSDGPEALDQVDRQVHGILERAVAAASKLTVEHPAMPNNQ